MYWTCLKRDNLALARQWSLKLMKNPNRIKKIWIRNATNVIKEVLFSKNELCSLKYQCSIAANENRMNFISWKLCISILALNVNFPKESICFFLIKWQLLWEFVFILMTSFYHANEIQSCATIIGYFYFCILILTMKT